MRATECVQCRCAQSPRRTAVKSSARGREGGWAWKGNHACRYQYLPSERRVAVSARIGLVSAIGLGACAKRGCEIF